MGNLPIGQGLSVTPMQMAAAYSAIADGGILRPPRLILDEGGRAGPRAGGPADHLPRRPPRSSGDARGRAGPGRYRLRGQRPRLHARRQDRYRPEGRSTAPTRSTQFVASFVGFAPAQDPELLVAVVVDEPRATTTAARSRRRRSARSPSSRCPTWASRPAALARGELPPRAHTIAAMKLRELPRRRRVADVDRRTRASRSPALALRQSRASSRERSSSASPVNGPTATTSRPRRSRRGAAALVVERPLELRVPQAVVADARAAMAPIAVALLRATPPPSSGSPGSPAPTGRPRRPS